MGVPDDINQIYEAAAKGVAHVEKEKAEGVAEKEAKKEAKKEDGEDGKVEEAAGDEKKRKYSKKKDLVKTQWFENKDHSFVYVQGLPQSITEEEFVTFMKKAGMIKEEDDGSMKIKIYKDSNGMPKGDAKCCYLKSASVD